jgi:hypothetical protein
MERPHTSISRLVLSMGGLILWVPSALAAERMRFLFGFVLGSGMLCVCGLARPLRYQFELHQYRHYINHVISSRIPWNSTAEDGMFKHWSTHHEPFHWRMGNERYIDYAINNNAKVRKWFPPIWDRRFYLAVSGEDAEGVNWKDFGPGMVSVEVDCVYGIVLEDVRMGADEPTHEQTSEPIHRFEEDIEFVFRVRQGECVSKTDIVGGASIESLAVFAFYQQHASKHAHLSVLSHIESTRCFQEDLFNNEYLLHCHVNVPNGTHPHKEHPQAALCVNASFILEYEHYDAFSELKYPVNTLNYLIPANSTQFANISGNSSRHSEYRDNINVQLIQKLKQLGYSLAIPAKEGLPRNNSHHVYCVLPTARDGGTSRLFPGSHNVSESASPSVVGFWSQHQELDVISIDAIVESGDVFPFTAAATSSDKSDTKDSINRDEVLRLHNFKLDGASIVVNMFPPRRTHRYIHAPHREPTDDVGLTAYMPYDQFRFCTQHINAVTYLGESHLRYIFDFNLQYYYNKEFDLGRLEPHHMTTYAMKTNGMIHEWQVFAHYAAEELVSSARQANEPIQTSPAEDDPVTGQPTYKHAYTPMRTIIVQTGTWDLVHWPLRNYMDNVAKGVDTFTVALETIYKERVEAVHKQGSSKRVIALLHLIFVDTMVHLRYGHNLFSEGWRNNFAIAAGNQKLFDVVLAFVRNHTAAAHSDSLHPFDYRELFVTYTLPEANIKISLFNSASMLFSRGTHNGAVCYAHSLCRNRNGMFTITQGLVMMNALNQFMCGAHVMTDALSVHNNTVQSLGAEESDELKLLSKVIEVYGRRILDSSSHWKANQYEELDIVFHVSDSGPSIHNATTDNRVYYLISKGFRRLIPDKPTRDWLIAAGQVCYIDRAATISVDSVINSLGDTHMCSKHRSFVVRKLPQHVVKDIFEVEPLPVIVSDGKVVYHCAVDHEVFVIDSLGRIRDASHCMHAFAVSNPHLLVTNTPNLAYKERKFRRPFYHPLTQNITKFCYQQDLLLGSSRRGPEVSDCTALNLPIASDSAA